MKIRMRFTKTGSMVFIGHLDCMRFFQKAIRRAKLDISYTKGFSPHPIMSFASPLSLGVSSDGEYMDAEFNSLPDIGDEKLIEMMNSQMTDEIFVTEIIRLDDKAKTSMALLNAADYMISFMPDESKMESFEMDFSEFMQQESIVIEKKTKKSTAMVDIKPHIQKYGLNREDFLRETGFDMDLHNRYDGDKELFVKLSSGSKINIKPEQVIDGFKAYLKNNNKDYEFEFKIHRLNMYFDE